MCLLRTGFLRTIQSIFEYENNDIFCGTNQCKKEHIVHDTFESMFIAVDEGKGATEINAQHDHYYQHTLGYFVCSLKISHIPNVTKYMCVLVFVFFPLHSFAFYLAIFSVVMFLCFRKVDHSKNCSVWMEVYRSDLNGIAAHMKQSLLCFCSVTSVKIMFKQWHRLCIGVKWLQISVEIALQHFNYTINLYELIDSLFFKKKKVFPAYSHLLWYAICSQ